MDGVALPVSTAHEATFELMTSATSTLGQFLTVCADVYVRVRVIRIRKLAVLIYYFSTYIARVTHSVSNKGGVLTSGVFLLIRAS